MVVAADRLAQAIERLAGAQAGAGEITVRLPDSVPFIPYGTWFGQWQPYSSGVHAICWELRTVNSDPPRAELHLRTLSGNRFATILLESP